MAKTITTRYDVAEHLRTPEEMAAYLEACLEEANGDAAFIAAYSGEVAMLFRFKSPPYSGIMRHPLVGA
jgi:DNA-binding phage protein